MSLLRAGEAGERSLGEFDSVPDREEKILLRSGESSPESTIVEKKDGKSTNLLATYRFFEPKLRKPMYTSGSIQRKIFSHALASTSNKRGGTNIMRRPIETSFLKTLS